MTAAPRLEDAAAEASLGDDALSAAEQLLAAQLPNDAVSRAYYAAFHYARALLLTQGLEPKTHRGVVSLLEERFASAGELSSEAVSALARLHTFRGLADYDARSRLPASRARAEVTSARQFVQAARVPLGAAGVELPASEGPE